ncbi:hypothetical protein [Bradyrhizobium cenepequi]
MKSIIVLAVIVVASSTIASSLTPAYAAAFGAMSGKADYATKGYKQGPKEKTIKGF